MKRFIKTENTEYGEKENLKTQMTERIPKCGSVPSQTIVLPDSQSHYPQNQDFLYGMLFGSFKSDFEIIKNKLGSIHTDIAENHSMILDKAGKNQNEIIGLLGDHRKQLSEFIEKAENQIKQVKLPTSLTKDLKQNIKAAKLSLRQTEIYEIAQQSKQVTAKQIAKQLRIAKNTATEHLRKLEIHVYLKRKQRGVYHFKFNKG